jgi:hypothetical protein
MVAPDGIKPVKVALVIDAWFVRMKSSADSCSINPFPAGVEALAIKFNARSLLYRTVAEAVIWQPEEANPQQCYKQTL